MLDTPAPSPTIGDFDQLMQAGAGLHTEGRREEALAAFEQALAQRPQDLNAATACASVLTELQRPQAAWAIMVARREALMTDADGACNLAVMAEACALEGEAQTAYEQALRLYPQHLRALNNRALMATRQGDMALAQELMQRAAAQAPQDPALLLNYADVLIAARAFDEAAQHLLAALARFPGMLEFQLRRIAALAFGGQPEQAQAELDALGEPGAQAWNAFLRQASQAPQGSPFKRFIVLPDMRELFIQQAFSAMRQCDWRNEQALSSLLRQMLGESTLTGTLHDWRDTQFYALMLALTEQEQTRIRLETDRSLLTLLKPRTPYVAPAIRTQAGSDTRLRIGIAAQTLDDERFANALATQLALHDRSRFALHVYSPTPRPREALSAALLPHCERVVELAHLSHEEAAQRVRVDRLDLWMDTAFYTPWCRVEITFARVAPVQIFTQTWKRYHPANVGIPCEYTVGDAFTHPDVGTPSAYGPVVRMPHSCWLFANDDAPTLTGKSPEQHAAQRSAAGLSANALVLTSWVPALAIDPHSFGTWMRLLAALPHAVLWLSNTTPQAKNNLLAAAQAHGIAPQRIVFMQAMPRGEALAQMPLADLFLDTLRFNANHGLADALRMGVPAVSCAGQTMASRLGGSIIRAAGLADCVVDSEAAYLDRVLHLGRNPAELAALRERLATAHSTAPLFDTAARVREWESAWVTMIERQRAGLPPIAFDVPASA